MANRTALIVVDVQNILFETPGYTLFDEQRVVGNIERLISKARSTNTPVIYIQHTTEGEGSEFAEGSHNWEIIERIAPNAEDNIFLKRTYDAFTNVGLKQKLLEMGVDRLVFCGLQTEVCVDTTIRSALAHGFTSILAGDAHSTYDTKALPAEKIIAHHNLTLHRRFCTVMDSDDIAFD